MAELINCNPHEIYFTGSGSESDNTALKGFAYANRKQGNHIITSKIEHHAILETCETLERQGFEVSYIDVDEDGVIKIEELEKTISSVKKQKFKNITILIEGKTKIDNCINSSNRKDTLKKVKTDYYTILHAGVEAKEEWLEAQLLTAIVSRKGVVIADYPRPLRSGANDNLCSFLLPIDGVILKKNDKV